MILFLLLGLCLLCVNACALGGNEPLQKAAAKVELSALMFQIESGLINIDAQHPEAMMRYREYETLLGGDRKRD
jgi:hypothetical protein